MLHDLICHEAMHGAELLGAQGLEQLLSTGPQPAFAVQHLVHGLVRHECLDRRGPHRAPAVVQRQHDAGDRDQALAGTGGCRQHDVLLGGERERGFLLMRVQRSSAGSGPLGEGVEHE